MSFGSKGSTTKTGTDVTTTSPNPYALQQYYNAIGKATQAASQPFVPYGGQLTAGLTAPQESAIAGLGGYQQQFGQAGQPISAGQIAQYSNPFLQNVIDTTQAQFNRQNEIGLTQLQGKVLGATPFAQQNSRYGLPFQEYLTGQQTAQNPIIAGLYQQNYQQALGAAQADRAAQLAAAQAGVGGEQALFGAGTQAQQTQQAALTAQYEQYLRQQGYPFETAQYLASIVSGLGPLMGQTATGQSTQVTTPPPPSIFGALAGLGTAGLALAPKVSRGGRIRAAGGSAGGDTEPLFARSYVPKASITPGRGLDAPKPMQLTDSGTTTTQSPNWLGLAKEAKNVDWGSVGSSLSNAGQFISGGFHLPSFFQEGGGVRAGLTPGTFIEPRDTFEDRFNALKHPGIDVRQGDPDTFFLRDLPIEYRPSERYNYGRPVRMAQEGGVMDAPEPAPPELPIPRKYIEGVKRFEGYTAKPTWDVNAYRAGYGTRANPGEAMTKERAEADLQDELWKSARMVDKAYPGIPEGPRAALASLTFNAGAGWMNAGLGKAVREGDWPTAQRLLAQYNRSEGRVLPGLTSRRLEEGNWMAGGEPQAGEPQALGFAGAPGNVALGPQQRLLSMRDRGAATPMAGADDLFSSPGVFGISPRAREALLAAGLGMMASRSPYALEAVGEGGLKGLGYYALREKQEAANELQRQKLQDAQERIGLQGQNIQSLIESRKETEDIRKQHQKLLEEQEGRKALKPSGVATEDGSPVFFDANKRKLVNGMTGEEITKDTKLVPIKGAPVTDEAGRALADRYVLTGNRRELSGMARSGANWSKMQGFIEESRIKFGLTHEQMAQRQVEFEGRLAGSRTLSQSEARMLQVGDTALGALHIARGSMDLVPRTDWMPVNELIQGLQTKGKLSDAQARLATRTQTLITEYSNLMNRGMGITTDASRDRAQKILNTAYNAETYEAVLDEIEREINRALRSPEHIRELYRSLYGDKAVEAPTDILLKQQAERDKGMPTLTKPTEEETAQIKAQLANPPAGKTRNDVLNWVRKRGIDTSGF